MKEDGEEAGYMGKLINGLITYDANCCSSNFCRRHGCESRGSRRRVRWRRRREREVVVSWLGRKEGERGDYIEELKVGGCSVRFESISRDTLITSLQNNWLVTCMTCIGL